MKRKCIGDFESLMALVVAALDDLHVDRTFGRASPVLTFPSEKNPAWVMGRTFLPALPMHIEARIVNELTFKNPAYTTAANQGRDLEDVPEFLHGWANWETDGMRLLVVPNYYRPKFLDPLVEYQKIEPNPGDFTFQMKYAPRPGQAMVMAFLAANYGDIGLKLPCGFGKTFLALAYASKFKGRTLVVLPNNERLDGWRQEIFLHTTVTPNQLGHVQADKRIWEDRTISVCMLKTLAMQDFPPEFLNGFTTVIWDEAHLAGAPMMSKALGKVNGRQVTLTATPGDGVRRKLIELHVGQNWKAEVAETRPLTVHMMRVNIKHPTINDKEWRIQKLIAAKSKHYSQVAANLTGQALADGRRVLVLNDLVDPLMDVAYQLKPLGHDVGFVIGQESLKSLANLHFPWLAQQIEAQEGKSATTRMSAYFQMVKAKANPILATGLKKTQPGGMGMDVATLDGGVVMFPTPDKDMTVQLAGRWARMHNDKLDPMLVVLTPNTKAGVQAAERMGQTLAGLPETNVVFSNATM